MRVYFKVLGVNDYSNEGIQSNMVTNMSIFLNSDDMTGGVLFTIRFMQDCSYEVALNAT